MGLFVFDLDGTIAMNEHRQHFVERPRGERDWKGFNEACGADTPCNALSAIILALKASGHTIAILSGRGSEVKQVTEYWLLLHNIQYDYLHMRAVGDHREDSILKLEMMRKLRSHYPDMPVQCIFDDRKRVVDMWRANGYKCFQVAAGDF